MWSKKFSYGKSNPVSICVSDSIFRALLEIFRRWKLFLRSQLKELFRRSGRR
jgi:hypothetical protein